MRVKKASDVEKIRQRILANRDKNQPAIFVSGGTCGIAAGANDIAEAFKKEIKKSHLEDKVEFKMTGCHGFCAREPVVVVAEGEKEIFYQQVKSRDVPEIISRTVVNKEIVERLLYFDPEDKQKIVDKKQIPFYKKQEHRLFANNNQIDPLSIEDYIATGGFTTLTKAFQVEPENIISEIKRAGLRGRGGAGFPTGLKWAFTRKAVKNCQSKYKNSFPSYMVCNADEGDPGAYMDRSFLEGKPHALLEGMIIGAWAICGNTKAKPQGYIYIRNEYPLALKHLRCAIKQAREYGFLGDNILGSSFDFDINIIRGAGAFVCGEETALLESVEDKIGEPRSKPPYPTNKGLWGMPTNINNVKTWASVPLIWNNGYEWFSKIGTENSKGTAIFALVGKINNTGLIEVPMGITLREIIYEVGGGILQGKKFKAVQTGGPSGGCIPESLLDMPVDYESLTKAGSIMGSGGMIVMDEDTCMVDTAKYFLNFAKEESCGKCTPCRDGIRHMLEILTKITEGKGEPGNIPLLERMGKLIKETSFCGLGRTAPNPLLTTIRYFRNEYEAHINDKRCPAKVCKPLINFSILENKCTGCHRCFKVCPTGAVSGEPKQPHGIDPEECIKCSMCYEACKFGAVRIE